jgi:protocatechuate 3,4-dioxygenase beta subunit
LPYFALSAAYPTGFTTAAETWNGSKMNTGTPALSYSYGGYANHYGGSTLTGGTTTYNGNTPWSGINSVVPFDEAWGPRLIVRNNGYGSITSLQHHMILDDSIYAEYFGASPGLASNYGVRLFWYSYSNKGAYDGGGSLGNHSTNSASNIDATQTVTILPDGKRYVTITISGNGLGGVDKSLDNGDYLDMYQYWRAAKTCIPQQNIKEWFTYSCNNGTPCSIPDTLRNSVNSSAGRPVVSTINSSYTPWDGCPGKSASFTFKNSGTPVVPGTPEVSAAYDVDLSVAIGGTLNVSNLTIGGSALVPTIQAIPGNVSAINWKVKNSLTFDPDGPGGLSDLDGDLFYDDMLAGDSVNVFFNWEIPCSGACGPDLNYDIKGVATYTDFCKRLNGSSSVNIYAFGLKQTAPVTQLAPVPNFGTMGARALETRTDTFSFNYQNINVSLANAVVKLRINYSKTMEVVEPIRFLGVDRSLGDFTVIGTGYAPPTGTTAAVYADTLNNTTDKDSALELTLTAAEVAQLFDNTGDQLLYTLSHISCDSFQNQSNNDNFQILFQFSSTPCPSGSAPCALDLACKKGFGYQINEGCGDKPCYRVYDSLYRSSAIGYTDITETTPLLGAPTKFYEGDTMTYYSTAQLSGDYPIMEDIGKTPTDASYALLHYYNFTYFKPVGPITNMTESPLQWIPELSYVKVIDTTTGAVLYNVNVASFVASDWYESGSANISDDRNWFVLDNLTTGYTPGPGLLQYYCALGSWTIDPAACPYESQRYRSSTGGKELYVSNHNAAQDRITDNYYFRPEKVLSRNGISFAPGYAKYKFVTEMKYRINPDFPHTNTGDYTFRGAWYRYGDGITPPPGTYMGACGNATATMNVTTKEISVQDPGKTYSSACGLSVCNSLYLKSSTGDYFTGGEVRVPYKLDSIVVDLPTEYYIVGTAATSYNYAQGGVINSGTATPSTGTGHVVWTSTGTNGEFPRTDDASGNLTAHSLCYALSNTGTDNFVTNNYRVPVVYYLRNEWGVKETRVDTISISEGVGDISITPLGGAVSVTDGNGCGTKQYMDLVVTNNNLYTAGNTIINVEGTASSTVLQIQDLGSPTDPISGADTGSVNSSRKYALIGAVAPGEQRIIRVYFNTTVCTDSLKFVSNFGCNYPAGNDIYANSSTLDSVYINFGAINPAMMVGAITPKVNVASTCDTVTITVEATNIKDPNLYQMFAGFKLPANMVYVANTARLNYVHAGIITNDAYYVNIPSTGVTTSGAPGDSLVLALDATMQHPNYLVSWGSGPYFYPGCGFLGASDQFLPASRNTSGIYGVIPGVAGYPAGFNKVRVQFKATFTACPSATSDAIFANMRGQSFCGTETKGTAVVNILYQGTTATPNTYSCTANSSTPLYICADSGQTQHVVDSAVVFNNSGPTTTGTDSFKITIGQDTNSFVISNFTAVGWPAPVVSITAEGRTTLTFAVPAGIAPGGNRVLPLEYDLTVKVKNFCSPDAGLPCADIAHSVEFFSTVNIDCAAKGITCPGLGKVTRGTGYVPRDLQCCAALGNRVWADSNYNGTQDGTEPGVANVMVELLDASGNPAVDGYGNPIPPVYTDANGNYMFDNLVPGSYSVRFTDTTNTYNFTSNNTPGDNANDTNSDAITGGAGSNTATTGLFSLASNETDTTVDAGIVPRAAIGNYVWEDLNANGIQDPGEPGIQGVSVSLYTTGPDGVYNTADDIYLTGTTTDANGYYQFSNLYPDDYTVWTNVSAVEGTNGNYVYTTPGTANDDGVANNSDGQVYTSPDNVWSRSNSVNLIAGENDTTIDFGMYKPASLGNQVFVDADGNGVKDPSEVGLPGTTVYLLDNAGVVIDSTTTDANGNYLFDSLMPGTYSVGFVYPAGYLPTTQTGTSDDSTDNTSDAATTPTNGMYVSAPVVLTSGENDTTIDAGVRPTGSLGNLVWYDANNDGIKDPTEQGIAGQTVYLYSVVAGVPTLVDSTITDANGAYLFDSLLSGDYQVGFPTSANGAGVTSQTTTSQTDNNSDADVATGLSPVVTINAAGTGQDKDNTTIDAGYYAPTASIGNQVWLDSDGDGTQDVGEPGVAGVTVSLYDAAGNLVATTVTDGTGKYMFTDLVPGDYSLSFTPPADYTFTSSNTPGDNGDNTNSDANTTPGALFGTTGLFTLSPGENDSTADAGLVPNTTQNVGDKVWYDTDKDGVQDAGEEGIAGVTVTLYDAAGNVVGTTVTNSLGEYLFTDVPAGTGYTIMFTPPVGLVFTSQEVSPSDTAGSNANPLSGLTAPFDVLPGQDNLTIDAGLYTQDTTLASVGNKVWEDLDQDGVQDPGEPGIGGVPVYLKDASGAIIDSTVTNELGEYIFNGLTPGVYSISFGTPAGYVASPYTAGIGDATNSDNNGGTTAPFTLAAGEKNLNVDAGFYQVTPAGTLLLGDQVWYDLDKDGVQDADEPGVAGVTVELLDASGTVIATTVTDANGNYLFPNLAAGTYQVQFSNLPQGYTFTSQDATGGTGANAGIGGTDDSDAGASGITGPITLTANNLDVDAGIIPAPSDKTLASIGNTVWYDTDNDGIQDAGETGVAGVTVVLKDAQGNVIDSTTTDAMGNYIFTGLTPGDYIVEFSGLPSGYSASPSLGGVNDPLNSDGVETAPGSGVFASGIVSLGAGENNANVDFGVYSPLNAIGDQVWYDTDNDGVQDAGEVGAAGITVTLYDNTGAPIASTVTDANGNYLFSNLPDGNYSVGFSNLPSGYSFSPSNTPGDNGDNSNSDANPSTGLTAQFALSGGEVDKTADAGIYNPNVGSIGGQIWADSNADGVQDPGETPTPGLIVTLKDGTGNVVGVAVTDGNGNYLFSNIPFGDYTVEFTNPDGTVWSPASPGGTGSTVNNDGSTGSTSVSITPLNPHSRDNDAGYYTPQLASVGDYVWIDSDGDGIQDSGEPPVAGVKVTLYNSAGEAVGTAITDENGFYQINDIPPGTGYYIVFEPTTLPSGSTFTTQDVDGTGVTGGSNSDASATGQTNTFDLAPGQHQPGIDAGILPSASIGSFVWNDANNDGIFDANEAPIPGVTIYLLDAGGNTIDSVVTDANGMWKFDVVPSTPTNPQSYSVAVDTTSLPAGFHISDTDFPVGGDGDNDADRATATTGSVSPGPGQYISSLWIGANGLYPLGDVHIALTGSNILSTNNLQWILSDAGGDVTSFTLYSSFNNAAYLPIAETTTGSSNTYKYADAKLATGTYAYYVAGNDKNGSTHMSNTVLLLVNGGNTVAVYPNPATDVINVAFDKAITEASTVVITDALGKVVYTTTIAAGQSSTSINVSDLANATYTISIQTEGASKQAVKFTKQ